MSKAQNIEADDLWRSASTEEIGFRRSGSMAITFLLYNTKLAFDF